MFADGFENLGGILGETKKATHKRSLFEKIENKS